MCLSLTVSWLLAHEGDGTSDLDTVPLISHFLSDCLQWSSPKVAIVRFAHSCCRPGRGR